MADHRPGYAAAYVGSFPASELDSQSALVWARRVSVELGADVTVIAPTKRHFREITLLAGLPLCVDRQTPQTIARGNGGPRPVVVSYWPTAQDLELLERSRGLQALAVVPQVRQDVEPWIRARCAVDLLGGEPAPAPAIADPVVAVAMRDLTRLTHRSDGPSHGPDRSRVIQALQLLRRHGHRLDPVELRTWAMANGWDAAAARMFGEYAENVLADKAYRTGPSVWEPDVVERWRGEVHA